MISNDRAKYSSAEDWLEALRHDELWQSMLQKLRKASVADVGILRDDAIGKIRTDDTIYGYWDSYCHQTENVVREVWQKPGLSLFHLKNQVIGMLTIEWLEQHQDTGWPNSHSVRLPKELDTPQAQKAFALAMEKRYMEASADGKYHWIGTGDKGAHTQLAYFLGHVYNYRNTITGNAGENFPEVSLGKLFGVRRLYSSLTQAYNAQKPQRWRSLIDALFE